MYAFTFAAPASFSACAALQSVPAVSIISSGTMQHFPATSPIIFITSDSFAVALLLSIIARSDWPKNFANALALTTPPASGDTTKIGSSFDDLDLMSSCIILVA